MKKVPPSQKGKHWKLSPETRARQKIAQRKEWDPNTEKGKSRLLKYREINSGINNPMYGIKLSDESKDKHRKSSFNMWENMSEETKKERSRKISESRMGNKNPAKREEVKEKIRQARGIQKFNRVSKIEILLNNGLKARSIKTVPQYSITSNGFVAIVDVFIPESNLCIYCDGDYWHNLPNYKIRDRKTNLTLKSMGYNVLRFWEKDINENIEDCINKIINYKN